MENKRVALTIGGAMESKNCMKMLPSDPHKQVEWLQTKYLSRKNKKKDEDKRYHGGHCRRAIHPVKLDCIVIFFLPN